jgi:hypothetical protein
MPVRFLSDAELARLSSWPDEIADDDLAIYFTLTSDDLGWLASTVQVENRLGAAVQLSTLLWLGWVPDDLGGCPPAAVRRLADQLQLAAADVPGLLSAYGWEGRTRRDHWAPLLPRLVSVLAFPAGQAAVCRPLVKAPPLEQPPAARVLPSERLLPLP